VLSQGNRAVQHVFSTPNDFDCYLLQLKKGQGSHLSTKSRLDVLLNE